MTRGVISAAKDATSSARASKGNSVSVGGRKYFLGDETVVS